MKFALKLAEEKQIFNPSEMTIESLLIAMHKSSCIFKNSKLMQNYATGWKLTFMMKKLQDIWRQKQSQQYGEDV